MSALHRVCACVRVCVCACMHVCVHVSVCTRESKHPAMSQWVRHAQLLQLSITHPQTALKLTLLLSLWHSIRHFPRSSISSCSECTSSRSRWLKITNIQVLESGICLAPKWTSRTCLFLFYTCQRSVSFRQHGHCWHLFFCHKYSDRNWSVIE